MPPPKADKAPKSKKRAARWRRARPLAKAVPGAVGPIFKKRGFAAAEILARWPEIVGTELAAACRPDALRFPPGKGDGATLHLIVAAGWGPHVQHLAPHILDRLNGYLGHKAAARVKLVPGIVAPPAPRMQARTPPPMTAAETAALADRVAGVQDPALRETLARLGRWVVAKPNRPPSGNG